MSFAGVLSIAVLLAPPPAGQEPEPSGPGSAEDPQGEAAQDVSQVGQADELEHPKTGAPGPFPPDVGSDASLEDVVRTLTELAAARPDLVLLGSLGKSAGGRDIVLATLGPRAREQGSPDRPALLVAGMARSRGDRLGALAATAFAQRWLRACEADELGKLAQGITVHVVPALDPDALATPVPDGEAPSDAADAGEAGEEREILFDRSFPFGWLPESMRPGSGEVPLERPEPRAALQFLEEHPAISLTIGTAPRGFATRPSWAQDEVPSGDLELFERLRKPGGMRPAVFGWTELASGGGGFFDAAYLGFGILPVLVEEPGGPGVEATGSGEIDETDEIGAWMAGFSERALEIVGEMASLEVEPEGMERLAPELWRFDFAVGNPGALPTSSELARARRDPGRVELLVQGAEVVAVAHREAGGLYRPEALRRPEAPGGAEARGAGETRPTEAGRPGSAWILDLDPIEGGGSRSLRLIVRASSGSQAVVLARSLWAGSARREIRVP